MGLLTHRHFRDGDGFWLSIKASPRTYYFRQYVELVDALNRLDRIDADQFASCRIRESLDNVAMCHPGLWINGVSIQLFCADYQGFFHERPSTAIGIFKLALDDTWLGIV